MSAPLLELGLEAVSLLLDADENISVYSENEEEKISDVEVGSYQNVLTKSEIAQQLLDEIESIVKKEDYVDAFSGWFEEKVELPVLDEIQKLLEAGNDEEEEELAGKSVEITNLTPPDTPEIADLLPEDGNWEEFTCEEPDIERELALVDEVVRSTAQSLEIDYSGRSEDCDSDDPEWVPDPKPARKRKAYTRCGDQADRKMRKKEQNKNAATRYRQKKKAEVSEILEEEKMLEQKKSVLEQKTNDLQLEIKYLKALMRDLFKARGIVS